MHKLIILCLLMLSTAGYSSTYYNDKAHSLSLTEHDSGNHRGKLIGYITGWKPAPAATDLVKAGYTHVVVAYGVFSTVTPGQIIPNFANITPDYIQSLQAAGIKVMLSLGGISTNMVNTTTDFHAVLARVSDPECFIEEFVNSMNDMLHQYHFDGFDIAIAYGLADAGSLVKPIGDTEVLARALHDIYVKHPKILLSLSPQMAQISVVKTLNGVAANYAALVMKTAPLLAWVGIQFYDSPSYQGIDGQVYGLRDPNSPDVYVAMASDLLENWPSNTRHGKPSEGLPYTAYLAPSQIVLGVAVANQSGVSDRVPVAKAMTVKRAIQCLRSARVGTHSCLRYVPPRAYSDFGGVSVWELSSDQSNQFRFSGEISACVKFGTCDESIR